MLVIRALLVILAVAVATVSLAELGEGQRAPATAGALDKAQAMPQYSPEEVAIAIPSAEKISMKQKESKSTLFGSLQSFESLQVCKTVKNFGQNLPQKGKEKSAVAPATALDGSRAPLAKLPEAVAATADTAIGSSNELNFPHSAVQVSMSNLPESAVKFLKSDSVENWFSKLNFQVSITTYLKESCIILKVHLFHKLLDLKWFT